MPIFDQRETWRCRASILEVLREGVLQVSGLFTCINIFEISSDTIYRQSNNACSRCDTIFYKIQRRKFCEATSCLSSVPSAHHPEFPLFFCFPTYRFYFCDAMMSRVARVPPVSRYALKVTFTAPVGSSRANTQPPDACVCDQRQFRPRMRDHSRMTRSIFEIPSLSANPKVHSRVAATRYNYFPFSPCPLLP